MVSEREEIMDKELLFSVTKKDFTVQTFRAGGKGGQKQNKTESGVRFIHRASGARGEARDNARRLINYKVAFRRCVDSAKFQAWLRLEAAKAMGSDADIDRAVEKAMQPGNIKVEYGE